MALPDAAIRAAKAQPKPFELYDDGGLFFTVRPSGGKLWRLKYRRNRSRAVREILEFPPGQA